MERERSMPLLLAMEHGRSIEDKVNENIISKVIYKYYDYLVYLYQSIIGNYMLDIYTKSFLELKIEDNAVYNINITKLSSIILSL